MPADPATSDAAASHDSHPLEQGIGYDLTVPTAAVGGIGITYANMRFCFDVKTLALRLQVNAVIGPVPPPVPILPPVTDAAVPAPPTPPAPPVPGPSVPAAPVVPVTPVTAPLPCPCVALAQLTVTTDPADLDPIIAWLSTLKGRQAMRSRAKAKS